MNSNNSHILIKNINKNNIIINDNYEIYRIYYNFNNSIYINKIIFPINNYTLDINSEHIKLYSNNFHDINIINSFLIKNIKNFSSIIKIDNNNRKYILLSNNKYTKNLEKYSTLYIYIKYVKKYNNIPIIHLLYGK